jgi:hypothetical protein
MIFLRLSAAAGYHKEQMTLLATSNHRQQTFFIGLVAVGSGWHSSASEFQRTEV